MTFVRYDVHSVMIDPHWALNEALLEDGWTLIYEDEMAKVFTDE